MMRRTLLTLVVAAATLSAEAAVVPDELLNSLSFRLVGPFRGGRVTAVTGVPGDPMTYYMGSTGGGVWKTTNAGHRLAQRLRCRASGRPDRRGPDHGSDRPRTGRGRESSAHRSRVCPRDRGANVAPAMPSARRPSAPLRSRRPIPTWSGSGTGSACPRGNVSPGDGVYKIAPMPETPGATWVSTRPVRSAASSSTPRIRTSSMSPCSGTSSAPIRSGASIAPPTGVSAGPRSSTSPTMPVRWISPWTPPTRGCSTPPSGRRGGTRGP